MDNASDALKMAGAMLLFVGALSIAIYVLSRARAASANIMAKKDANKAYYAIENVQSEKEVGIDTVIASMYNYYQTQSTIVFYKKTEDKIEPMPMYYSEASDKIEPNKGLKRSTLDKATLSIYNMAHQNITDPEQRERDTKDKRSIFGIDIHDELTRQEPWTRNEETAKKFIDAMVNKKASPGYDISLYNGLNNTAERVSSDRGHFGEEGNIFEKYGKHQDQTTGNTVYDYRLRMNFIYKFDGNKALIDMVNAKFIERVGIYNYETFYTHNYVEDNILGNHLVTNYDGSEVDPSRTYFNETDESIDNGKGEKKTVIEYIYVGNS